tara:strand:- start:288 stop:785 length:498 start_codon:yes stop_codon:yes gene_type:complete
MAYFFPLNCKTLFITLISLIGLLPLKMFAAEQPIGDGIWFTCEFTQSKTPPTDRCEMFDDEGFKAKEGQLSYLRMIGSAEVNCKGQKQGQCFPADLPQITVQTKPIGAVRLDANRLYVKWYGCTQDYRFFQGEGFVTVKPEGKDCFWSRERHFYVAPYKGQVHQQ